MAICLGDDGTLDTVVYCSDCGEEARYNYCQDGPYDHDDDILTDDGVAYDAFVSWALEDFASEHVCEHVADDPRRV